MSQSSQRAGRPPVLDDRWSAIMLRRAATNKPLPEDIDKRLDHEWLDGLTLAQSEGQGGIDRFVANFETRHGDDPELVRRVKAALAAALDDPGGDPGAEAPGSATERPAPPPFNLGLVKTGAFFAETYQLEYLVKGIVVKDQPCVFGGPQKSLKTSILIDMMISLASGTPFLGHFAVPRRRRVALISGESGRAVIQANAKQICSERDLHCSEAADIFWGFQLPQLCNVEHLAVVARTIRDEGIEFIAFDPLYLSLLAGNAGIDPKDMFQMGPLLAGVAETCLGEGATPEFCHHFAKHRDDPFGPPDMGELAYAGIGQFMRQWMLTSRRERYDAESGMHPLYFHYGGSAGHSGELHIDIETGVVDEDFRGRRWRVNVSTPGESRVARDQQVKADKERKEEEKIRAQNDVAARKVRLDAEAIEEFLARLGKATETKMREIMSPQRVKVALGLLMDEKRIRKTETKVGAGSGKKGNDAFELMPPDSSDTLFGDAE